MTLEHNYLQAVQSCVESALAEDAGLRVWRSHRRSESNGSISQTAKGLAGERTWVAPDDVSSLPSLATGAALAGLRLLLEMDSAEELLQSADELVFEMGELCRVTSRGLPIVIRAWLRPTSDEHLGRVGAHPLLLRCPWLDVVAPGDVGDAVGLLRAALASGRPVLFLEHAYLARTSGPLPPGGARDSLRRARIRQPGSDVTLVAVGWCNDAVGQAVELLRKRRIEAEWIDPRSLAPLDFDTITASVRKTGRLVVVEGAYRTLGIGAELAAHLSEHALDELDAPVARLGESRTHAASVVEAVENLLGQ